MPQCTSVESNLGPPYLEFGRSTTELLKTSAGGRHLIKCILRRSGHEFDFIFMVLRVLRLLVNYGGSVG